MEAGAAVVWVSTWYENVALSGFSEAIPGNTLVGAGPGGRGPGRGAGEGVWRAVRGPVPPHALRDGCLCLTLSSEGLCEEAEP